MNNDFIFLFIILCIFLFVVLIISSARVRKHKDNTKREQKQKDIVTNQYNHIYKDFLTYKADIEQKTELEKEIAKRRRVSPSVKKAVLTRDNYTCQICGISKNFLDELCKGLGEYLLLEIDHIQSVVQGGTGKDEDNLQFLCWRCNRKKGGKKTNDEVKRKIDYGIEKLLLPSKNDNIIGDNYQGYDNSKSDN